MNHVHGEIELRQFCGLVAARFGRDTVRLELRCSIVGDACRLRFGFDPENVPLYQQPADDALVESVYRLREAAYRSREGAWWSAHVVVAPDGTYTARFNYQQTPDFGSDAVRSTDFATDQRRFPARRRPPA